MGRNTFRNTVRVVKIKHQVKGFRTSEIVLVTTLSKRMASVEKLAELYMKRWDVELFFRDIKVSLGMDILKSQKPRQVQKEILMYAIIYNVIRGLMYSAAKSKNISAKKVSFKGVLDQLKNWSWMFIKGGNKYLKLRHDFYNKIVDHLLIFRPERVEPRCRKKRPKNYILMNLPRNIIQDKPHRNRVQPKTTF